MFFDLFVEGVAEFVAFCWSHGFDGEYGLCELCGVSRVEGDAFVVEELYEGWVAGDGNAAGSCGFEDDFVRACC